MPIWLDTRGNSVLSVAVCDRCNRKFAYVDLQPDPNFPGMRVCKDDLDNFDPWRLPARQTENIALRFPRPDVSVALQPNLLTTQGDPNSPPQYDTFALEGTPYGIPNSTGDLNLASNQPPGPSSLYPFISNVTGTSGPKAGGTTVTLTGLNFGGVTTVKFGNQLATFTINSSTEIVAVSPAYPVAGLVDISVTSTYGTATYFGAFTYT